MAFLWPRRPFSCSLARSHRTRLVHYHRPAHQFLTMAILDRLLRRGVIVDFDEAEPAGLSRKTVSHDGYGRDRNPLAGEKILYVRLICRVREISYKELLHLKTPQNTEHYFTRFGQSQRGLLLEVAGRKLRFLLQSLTPVIARLFDISLRF
jgi:hypothetical protein